MKFLQGCNTTDLQASFFTDFFTFLTIFLMRLQSGLPAV